MSMWTCTTKCEFGLSRKNQNGIQKWESETVNQHKIQKWKSAKNYCIVASAKHVSHTSWSHRTQPWPRQAWAIGNFLQRPVFAAGARWHGQICRHSISLSLGEPKGFYRGSQHKAEWGLERTRELTLLHTSPHIWPMQSLKLDETGS